jgi:hypothetical protein
MTNLHPFKWRHFQSDMILFCVRWYLRSALSYRDLEEMMAERGHAARSHHDLPLGSNICSRIRQTMPTASQGTQRLLENRRDIYQGQKRMDVPLPRSRF